MRECEHAVNLSAAGWKTGAGISPAQSKCFELYDLSARFGDSLDLRLTEQVSHLPAT